MEAINLYLGDCLEAMRAMPDKSYDLAIVDPPYGLGFSDYKRGGTDSVKRRHKAKSWDDQTPQDEYFEQLKRVAVNYIVWGGNYFTFLWREPCQGFIYWHKGNPVPNFSDGELAYTSFKKPAKQYDYRYYGGIEGKSTAGQKIHPTQKPVQLYEWLLDNYAERGQTILDTHLGSGSIAIACHNRGFSLDAWEIDPDYFASATKRFIQHKAQLTIWNP